jgi:uncharacterized protein (DUF1499 family)
MLHVVDAEAGFIEAAVDKRFLGLRDDVAIRVRHRGETTIVDVRSASRFGPADFGVNAARIAAFLRQLGAELAVRDPRLGPNGPF